MSDNPFVKPGANSVDRCFKPGGWMPYLGLPFKDVEEMRQSFDHPERLKIVEVAGVQYLRLKESHDT